MRRWFGSHGCSCDLTSCTTNKKAEIKMARILMLVVFASLLSFALASDSATMKPSGSTTTKHTPAHTTKPTTLPPTTWPTLVPPTEPLALQKNNTFILYDLFDHKKVCLKMIINMTVVYTYKNATDPKKQKTVTILDPMDGLARIVYDNNVSFCRLGGPSAWLTLRWQPEYNGSIVEPEQRTISFNFSASQQKGSRHWTFDAVHFDVVFSQADFPDYYAKPFPNTLSYKSDGFFEDEVEYQRGYQCLASKGHNLKNVNDSGITAKVTVKDFRVQAFEFRNSSEFGNFRKCLADSGDGNKIVPIAVGVALAVLVIAVIIAFFISKLVNRRRQTSYETLN